MYKAKIATTLSTDECSSCSGEIQGAVAVATVAGTSEQVLTPEGIANPQKVCRDHKQTALGQQAYCKHTATASRNDRMH